MTKINIIKIGGHVIDNEQSCKDFLSQFAALSGKKILVHGGGILATQMAEKMQLPQQMLNGRRITDDATLQLVTMVYAGWINKNIVAQLQAQQCDALGLCGADGHVIQSHKRVSKNDFGFVGDVDEIAVEKLEALLEVFDTLVIAPISVDTDGQLLNTNADTVAQELAQAFAKNYEVDLTFTFENAGVLLDVEDNKSLIRTLNWSYFQTLKKEHKIFDGMIPKLENAFKALQKGVSVVTIGNAIQLNQLIKGNTGTKINL